MEVELENGRVHPSGPETLPPKAHALLTILEDDPAKPAAAPPRTLGQAMREYGPKEPLFQAFSGRRSRQIALRLPQCTKHFSDRSVTLMGIWLTSFADDGIQPKKTRARILLDQGR